VAHDSFGTLPCECILIGALNVFRAVRDVGALLQFFNENTGCRDGFWLEVRVRMPRKTRSV